MRIALFTPYSPEIGGGSVQLRSHIERMQGLDITWYYLAKTQVAGVNRNWLGKPFTPTQFAFDLSARTKFLPGSTSQALKLTQQLDADLYWIVAHYEGISVAAELLAQGKKVHLTVHDEPLAMLIRSRRYRALYPLVSKIFKRVLSEAKSVDVTSWGMRDYFKEKYGLNSFALYRSLSELPQVRFSPKPNELRVGHIGSLYHPGPFRRFVQACREYAMEHNSNLRIVRVGISPEMDRIAAENPEVFESCGELEEREALPVLANCNFLYAMYPDGFRFQGFRRTSLPIKLSTYIQAQRPIFAHTPNDSTMARVISHYKLGRVCPAVGKAILLKNIAEILGTHVGREQFEIVRNELMGEAQVEQLRKELSGLPKS